MKAKLVMIALAVGSMIVPTGCSDSPSAPAVVTPMQTTTITYGIYGQLTAEVLDAMKRAIQDEYHAEFVYLKVIEKFGQVQPFDTIVNAEVRHSASIAQLFTRHGLTVPASNWNLNNVPQFATLVKACAAGVDAEIANIALYDQLLMLDLPADVRQVFDNVRAASLDKHLPAFERCCDCNR